MPPLSWTDVAGLEPSGEGAADAEALLEGLNPAQREAVTHPAGPLLIVAGAGSGKTRVITRRVAWLVATGRADATGVLAITFTNKAAREMRERVEALLPARGLWVSTFHSMCARLLRREIDALPPFTSDFSIYDTQDRNTLIKELVKELGYDTTRFRPAMVGSWISARKNSVVARDGADGADGGFEHELLGKVAERYEQALKDRNALDFDDLLLRTLELFEREPGVLDRYAQRFAHVLVDEYQDTNHVQYLLTRALSAHHRNLTVCGDPDQSIYAWRGADIRNILDFEEDNPGAEVVKLEQNYRSTRNILDAAQGVIRHNAGRVEKRLVTEAEAGEPLVLIEAGDENEEADEIAARIRGLQRDGASLDDVAVFYRVNFQQRALERGLRLAGVPYRIAGGVEFYQRKEVRDLTAYLQLLVNPADDVACARVLNVPARGIGGKSVERLAAFAADRRVPLARAVASEEARRGIRGPGRKGLAAFAALLERLADLRERPAGDALQTIVDEVGYFVWLAREGDDLQAGREENVQELLANAESYDHENPDGGVRGFLQDIALVSDVDGVDEDDDAAKVTLMTLHSAKGLEYPTVFLTGLEEELLPHFRAIEESGDDGVEEERRLVYVGLTRARERVFLTWARTRTHYGEGSWRSPSRFLDEVPPELVGGLEEERASEDLGGYEPEPSAPELSRGDYVRHAHFGVGRVEALQGSGVNARATVAFPNAGSKILLLQYAKLERVEGVQ